LVKIGNFQGIRIPKAFIEKAKLEDCELDLTLMEQGLLISANLKPRADWKAQVETLGVEPLDSDLLNADLNSLS
jgi:antitoxin MazE